MKKLVSVLLSLTLAAGLLSGCGSDSASGKTTIKVAASSTPHAEILENCKEAMAADARIVAKGDYLVMVVANTEGADYTEIDTALDEALK